MRTTNILKRMQYKKDSRIETEKTNSQKKETKKAK